MKKYIFPILAFSIIATAAVGVTGLFEKSLNAQKTSLQIIARIMQSMTAPDRAAFGYAVMSAAQSQGLDVSFDFYKLTPELQAEFTIGVTGGWENLRTFNGTIQSDVKNFLTKLGPVGADPTEERFRYQNDANWGLWVSTWHLNDELKSALANNKTISDEAAMDVAIIVFETHAYLDSLGSQITATQKEASRQQYLTDRTLGFANKYYNRLVSLGVPLKVTAKDLKRLSADEPKPNAQPPTFKIPLTSALGLVVAKIANAMTDAEIAGLEALK